MGERGFNNLVFSLMEIAVGTYEIMYAGVRVRDV